ncbi:MAG: aminotransferase class IV [Verrucomicrobiota bacterium]
MTPYIQANTNGRLHPASEPSISPLNRGFLYGDAIYEVWRTYDRVIFAWEEHWKRLERSAAALHLGLPWNRDALLQQIRLTVAAYGRATDDAGELYIRLQISRGDGRIGLDPALADRPGYVLLVQPVPTLSENQLEQGQVLSVATELRRNPALALNPAWKTGNYLNNLLCLREARVRGADEVVILNLAGEITEAAVCNLGFVRAGELLTPPLSAGILAGITRGLLLDKIAAAAGVVAREQTIRPQDLADIDECCLLSTTKDLQPVARIDGHGFRTGPDTVTRRLKAAFADHAADYARRHAAGLKV